MRESERHGEMPPRISPEVGHDSTTQSGTVIQTKSALLGKLRTTDLEVNEMDMRHDKIRNGHIRGTTRVVLASKKITEKRLKWYGHVRRMKEEHIVRRMYRCGHTREKSGTSMERCVLERYDMEEDNTTNRAEWRNKIISYSGDPS